jgi:hypothetical protein
MVPAQSALAQKPEPPGDESIDGPPSIESMPDPVREVTQKAVSLQESLTAEQHAAVREILDKYQPEMHAIADVLVAGKKPAVEGEPQPVDRDVVKRMNAMFDAIDTEIATVLNAEQLALYRAVMNPDFLDSVMSKPIGADAPKQSPNAAQGYTDACSYSPTYQAIAKLYSLNGYIYAYYSYYYYGGDYAYYAMVYASYALSYGDAALSYSGQCYFETYYAGMMTYYDDTSYAYWAYSYGDDAYYYGEYAYLYGYYDYYYYYSSDYAYYNYLYNYYAYVYADAANSEAYYCYYYW